MEKALKKEAKKEPPDSKGTDAGFCTICMESLAGVTKTAHPDACTHWYCL